MKEISTKLTKMVIAMLVLLHTLFPVLAGHADVAAPFCARGIDVSRHNGNIDWAAVKNSGIDFAIIRTSYGWENWDHQTDSQLINNINGAKAVGIPIGAYHYS